MKERQRTVDLFVWSVGAIALYFHAQHFYPFIADDSLISLRYARNLVAGHGLVWNPGERVEGYSNLLYILIVAALNKFGLDLIVAARVVNAVSSLVALGCLTVVSRGATLLVRVALTLLFAMFGCIAVWSVGGLEAMTLVALVGLAWTSLLADPASNRRRVIAGIALGFAAWTRPDAMLFTAVIACCLFVFDRRRRRPLAAIYYFVAVPVAAWLAQLLFRLAYYHDYVPNTARVKIEWRLQRVFEGAAWVSVCLGQAAPVLLLAVIATAILWRKKIVRWQLLILWAPCVAWLTYVLLVGGDIFPGQRHFTPVALALLLVLAVAAPHLQSPRATLLLCLAIPPFFALQYTSQHNRDAFTERWEYDGQSVALALKATFGDRAPLIAVASAGSIPYWSELPALDTLGLNDAHISRGKPRPRQKRVDWPGHTLGDGAYMLARKPDLMLWCGVYGSTLPCFPGEGDLRDMAEFKAQYENAWFYALPPRPFPFPMWIRVDSSRVGLQIDRSGVVIPAYLLGTSQEQPAVVIDNRWARLLVTGHVVKVPALQLPPGRWRMSADANGVTLRNKNGDALPLEMQLGATDDIGQVLSVEGRGQLFAIHLESITK